MGKPGTRSNPSQLDDLMRLRMKQLQPIGSLYQCRRGQLREQKYESAKSVEHRMYVSLFCYCEFETNGSGAAEFVSQLIGIRTKCNSGRYTCPARDSS